MADHCDLIIAGGGLSALLLGYFLKQNVPSLDFKIYESRESYEHDRHWGAWLSEDQQKILPDIIHRCYNRWDIQNNCDKEVHCHCDKWQYCIIRSGDFYKAMQNLLRREIVFGKVCQKIDAHHIKTNDATHKAAMVINALPLQSQNSQILQQFFGWTVETDHPIFDQEAINLMDFSIDQPSHACGFMYAIPFSETKALIEPTIFTQTLEEKSWFEHQRDSWLYKKGAKSWTILETENAILPMAHIAIKTGHNDAFPIGNRAGWMRPSSGYAFYETLKLTQKLAQYIAENKALPDKLLKPYSSLASRLDQIYLKVLETQPEIMPDVFTRWFHHMPPENMVDFLNNEADILIYLRLLWNTPHKDLFLKCI